MKRRNWTHATIVKGTPTWPRNLIVAALVLIGGVHLYLVLASGLIVSSTQSSSHPFLDEKKKGSSLAKESRHLETKEPARAKSKSLNYNDYRQIAVRLAELSPSEILRELQTNDPFQTRAFSKRVEQAEAAAGGRISLEDFKQLFGKCPSDRLSLPDQRDHAKASAFREGTGFLFFQHLRKAGGTHFCTMAEDNFPRENLPTYYCMPDYHWPRTDERKRQEKQQEGHACAGCLHRWSNAEIVQNMKRHRIAGNEWDPFDSKRHFDLPAVFVTSFRKPLDRALSQYRFECVEERGCQIKDVGEFWEKRRDLYNIYTWTFSDVARQASFATAATKEAAEQRIDAIGKALDTIVKFHLVMAMEWIPYSEATVRSVLGFADTTTLTKHVRPFNDQKKRNDSWKPEDYLTAEQYTEFSQNLALDEILTDAAHRLFLERLVCDEL